jgi:hypothetical protein
MAGDDFYSLSLDDEPTAAEHAAALSAALRRKQQLGNLDSIIGGPLERLGASELSQAGQGQQLLAQAGERRLQRTTEAQRNAALAQYHQDVIAQREAPKFVTAGDRESGTYDPKTQEFRPLVAAPPPKLVRGGVAAPAADVTLETAKPWELAAAHDYAKTGSLPPLGRDVESKKRILTLASIINGTGGVATSAAGFHADKASLAEGTKAADVTDVAEGKALGDIGILERQMKPLTDTGSPWLNRPIRELQEHSGNPDVAAFLTARVAAVAQINKVINSGTLTESARKEAEELLKPDATMAQTVRVLGVLKQDMARSKEAMHQRVSNIQARMGGKSPEAGGGDMKAKASARIKELIAAGVTDRKAIREQLGKEGFAP